MATAKKPASKKLTTKKSGANKATAKKATVKKATTKKTVVKKSVAKKPVKKTVTKGQEVKKTAAKKADTQKADTKKATTKKVVPKKTESKTKATKEAPKKEPTKAEKKFNKKEFLKSLAPKQDVFRCPVSGIPVKHEKPNLSEKTLGKLKASLLEERERHLAQAAELALEADELIKDREAGDTQFDEESGEGDSVAVERERTLFLSAQAQGTVDQIDRALKRIEQGTYGLCVPSSRRINVARLEALPWTEICVDCKQRSERRR